jgi:Flp pilus assembly protein TadG
VAEILHRLLARGRLTFADEGKSMQKRSKAAGLIRGFLKDRRGNFMVLTASIASVLMLSAGYAVDIAQLHNARSRLGHALDAAVTSTARDLTVGKIAPKDARGMVEIFLRANGDPQFMDSDRLVLDSLVVDQSKNTVEATAHVDVDLYFPLFGSGDTRRVSNISAAVYSDKAIEVAIMLDVTGSMKGQKLKDLKAAASNAVDAFLDGQDPARPRVRVSIVPYANSVNVGSLAASTVFVERKASDRAEAPGNDDPLMVSAAGATRPDNCATERKGTQQYTDAGPDVAMVNRDLLLTQYAKDFKTAACPTASIVPLTADKAVLKKEIGNFVAEGGTGGHIGVQWAWYMLSESWGGVMKKSERPAEMDKKKVAKYAILMTDGEFNLSYFDVDTASKVYDEKGKEPTRTSAKKLCAAMRAEGIEIFTVGFKLENSYAKATMKECANPDTSAIKHYYDTSSGAELDRAFQDIARNIERLAITK